VETCLSIEKESNLLILSFNPALVATLRRGVKKLGLTQRRYGATTKKIKRLMKVFKTSRSGVAAWRETFKPHATARRRNERYMK
jgi:hypothetical protein